MAWTKRYEGGEPQRINKWLAQSGVCSRREAEALILEGKVIVDGVRITELGYKISVGQTLVLNREASAGFGVTVVVNKPVGGVSAHPEPGQWQASDLLTPDRLWGAGNAELGAEISLPPLGRLDRDSRGLLILSEDGVLAKAIIGPESDLDKEYQVRVVGTITPRKLALLRHGITLDNRLLREACVEQVGEQDLVFVLKEGRNRQIRRMAEAVSLYVTDLERIRIGPMHLGDLPEGCWRYLSAAERDALVRAGSPPP
jgi:23S rRNA pseudouridine2604 synthase